MLIAEHLVSVHPVSISDKVVFIVWPFPSSVIHLKASYTDEVMDLVVYFIQSQGFTSVGFLSLDAQQGGLVGSAVVSALGNYQLRPVVVAQSLSEVLSKASGGLSVQAIVVWGPADGVVSVVEGLRNALGSGLWLGLTSGVVPLQFQSLMLRANIAMERILMSQVCAGWVSFVCFRHF